jgi:hypothetical protein
LIVKLASCFCSFLASAWLPLQCDAQIQGATAKERADVVSWAAEEPSNVAKRSLPSVDYPAVVRRCLERDKKSFRNLFALSAHTDAAASEMQSAILAIVLKQVGDDFFAAQLASAPKTARQASIELLRYEIVEQTPTPHGMNLKRYPEMMRLLKAEAEAEGRR